MSTVEATFYLSIFHAQLVENSYDVLPYKLHGFAARSRDREQTFEVDRLRIFCPRRVRHGANIGTISITQVGIRLLWDISCPLSCRFFSFLSPGLYALPSCVG